MPDSKVTGVPFFGRKKLRQRCTILEAAGIPQFNFGGSMAGEWAFYNLECRSCGNKGLAGVWKEITKGVEFWNSEWDGFFGFINQKAGPTPDTVQCMKCFSREVNCIERDAIAANVA